MATIHDITANAVIRIGQTKDLFRGELYMYATFQEIVMGIIVVMAFGFFFGDMVNDMRDGQNIFKILDGCEDAILSCNHSIYMLQKDIFDLTSELSIKDDELKAKDKELKSEAFMQSAKERDIIKGLLILIISIFFGCYLLLDKYFNLKKDYLKTLHVKAKTTKKDVKKR